MKNHPIRYYTPKGREMFVNRPGQIVPAGSLEGAAPFAAFPTDMVAVFVADPANPYDQGARDAKRLCLVPKK